MVVSAGYAEIGDTPLPEGTRLLDKPVDYASHAHDQARPVARRTETTWYPYRGQEADGMSALGGKAAVAGQGSIRSKIAISRLMALGNSNPGIYGDQNETKRFFECTPLDAKYC